ncbi:stage II sporulation protein P, partial [Bacillus vallismortis]|nr:stage II sporulation protein P [Bacillus vallismortis]
YNHDRTDSSPQHEIGGVDNTLKELQRSADAAADVFSEIYWDAEKVNAESGETKKQ